MPKPADTASAPAKSDSWQDTLAGWAKGGLEKVTSTVKSWTPAEKAQPQDAQAPAAPGGDAMAKQMETLGLKDMPEALSKLQSALKDNALTEAEGHAKKLDQLLGSDALQRALEILKVQASSGTAAAIAAVEKYLATPGLKADARRIGEEILEALKSVKRDDAVAIVALVTYLSLESKISHDAGPAAAMAGAVTEDLWNYIAAQAGASDGNPQYQWDRSNLKSLSLGVLAAAREVVDPSERLAREVTPSMVELVNQWADAVRKGDKGAVDSLFHPDRRAESGLPKVGKTPGTGVVGKWNIDLLFHRGAMVGLQVELETVDLSPVRSGREYFLMVIQRGLEHDTTWKIWDVMPWAGYNPPP